MRRIVLLVIVCGCTLFISPESVSATQVSVSLTETTEAFKNPMKGFRRSRYPTETTFTPQEYATIYKHYIPYTNLEVSASDPLQKIKNWCDTAWLGIENKNIKIIPRVLIYYPGTGEWWPGGIPHDGTPNQWVTDTLKNRLVTFIAKLGLAWDNDPRVAGVEMGLWGKWGEHNIYPDVVDGSNRIPPSFQQALGTAYTSAFKNKKVAVRYEGTFTDYNFGYYWDSFALPNDVGWANWMATRNCWPTQMITGEVAYDWGDQTSLGGSPNGTMSSNANTDYVIGYIRNTHCSSLGWIAEYTPDNGTISSNAAKMQKSFGYRFVITNASFPSTVASGGAMSVSLTVVNKGCAPFYYQWPVKASLLKADKTPAWSGTFTTDIRKWMPDSTNTVSGSFSIPSGLSSGIYTLAFSVNDPAGDLPSLRFANTNYFTGGYTPVGKVGIGMDATDQSLGNFDGLQADNTLRYKLTSSATDTIAPTTPLHLTMAAHTDTTVTLSWDAATDNVGVLGYALYKNGAYYASSTTTSVVAGGLLSQTANSFTVKAIDGAGNESTPSEALSASTDIRRYTSYEAELTGNTLTGTAVVATETHCSGQKKVGYIGNTTGTLQFNSVTAPAAGNYLMTIYFLSAVSRDLTLTINRGQPRTITCLPSGGWTSVGDTSITVTIDKGNNTISFSNATGWAPDIDRIVLNIPEDHAVKATKSQAAGTADGKMSCFFKNGQLRILFGKKSPKGPLQLSLFNCNGRLVGTSTAEIVGSGVNEVKFADVEKSFTSGYFIITIQANGKYIFSRKVVTLN